MDTIIRSNVLLTQPILIPANNQKVFGNALASGLVEPAVQATKEPLSRRNKSSRNPGLQTPGSIVDNQPSWNCAYKTSIGKRTTKLLQSPLVKIGPMETTEVEQQFEIEDLTISTENHDRRFDSNFLVDVELEPGPLDSTLGTEVPEVSKNLRPLNIPKDTKPSKTEKDAKPKQKHGKPDGRPRSRNGKNFKDAASTPRKGGPKKNDAFIFNQMVDMTARHNGDRDAFREKVAELKEEIKAVKTSPVEVPKVNWLPKYNKYLGRKWAIKETPLMDVWKYVLLFLSSWIVMNAYYPYAHAWQRIDWVTFEYQTDHFISLTPGSSATSLPVHLVQLKDGIAHKEFQELFCDANTFCAEFSTVSQDMWGCIKSVQKGRVVVVIDKCLPYENATKVIIYSLTDPETMERKMVEQNYRWRAMINTHEYFDSEMFTRGHYYWPMWKNIIINYLISTFFNYLAMYLIVRASWTQFYEIVAIDNKLTEDRRAQLISLTDLKTLDNGAAYVDAYWCLTFNYGFKDFIFMGSAKNSSKFYAYSFVPYSETFHFLPFVFRWEWLCRVGVTKLYVSLNLLSELLTQPVFSPNSTVDVIRSRVNATLRTIHSVNEDSSKVLEQSPDGREYFIRQHTALLAVAICYAELNRINHLDFQ